MKYTKEQFAIDLDKVGLKQADRKTVRDQELYVADGFVTPDKFRHTDKFGVDLNSIEYPYGAYVTLVYMPRHSGTCGVLVFEPDHDPSLDLTSKKKARINSAFTYGENSMNRRELH